ncbi:acyl carrier protein [Pedobacter cryoconitis]|uniref:Acyl carrier protein n=1 Tax=Pedobacter cryoconitis TaxID=188932 RepID=A0A7W8ZIK5_9SPHI|nr:phosphopantetheine-binding protein [Pedobacter cryoconitis]MBB5634714.1 acyl carrier protein [Pedobacter cryoconitis]MBB6272155.1 acyl carrier protein [Pedobacter cryoconitis]
MDREVLIAAIKEIAAPYTEDKTALDTINEDTDFIKDLKINSANLVDIVLDLEEKFGIEIDNDSMAKMLDVKSTVEVIEAKLAAHDRK